MEIVIDCNFDIIQYQIVDIATLTSYGTLGGCGIGVAVVVGGGLVAPGPAGLGGPGLGGPRHGTASND